MSKPLYGPDENTTPEEFLEFYKIPPDDPLYRIVKNYQERNEMENILENEIDPLFGTELDVLMSEIEDDSE